MFSTLSGSICKLVICHTMKGIPTIGPRGIQFRSRIEAQWAYLFAEFGWDWEYEPFDLKGYIPDFIITFHDKQLLVEVKGEANIWKTGSRDNGYEDGYHNYVKKIYESGWKGYYMVVGSTYKNETDANYDLSSRRSINTPVLATLIGVGGTIDVDKNLQSFDVTAQLEWAKEHYGSKYDYSKFKPFGREMYIRILEDNTIVLQRLYGETFSKSLITTDIDKSCSLDQFEKAWSNAKNKVQWKSSTKAITQTFLSTICSSQKSEPTPSSTNTHNDANVVTVKDMLLSEGENSRLTEFWGADEITCPNGIKFTSSPFLSAAGQALNKLGEEEGIGQVVSLYLKCIEDILRCDIVVKNDKHRLIKCLKRVIEYHDIHKEEPKWGNCDVSCCNDHLAYIFKVHPDSSVSFVKSVDLQKYHRIGIA